MGVTLLVGTYCVFGKGEIKASCANLSLGAHEKYVCISAWPVTLNENSNFAIYTERITLFIIIYS